MKSDELKSKYPYMFTGANIGLDLYEGWNTSLVAACDSIDALLGDEKAGFHFSQIKEKYGSARYYFEAESLDFEVEQRIQDQLDKAELATESTCMLCGAPACIENHGGWFLCLCDVHASERKAEGIRRRWPHAK